MKNVFLTYYQVMIFIHKIKVIKEENPYFKNDIVKLFEDYVTQRSDEIASFNPNFIKRLIPGYDKFIITKNMYDYLKRLTGVGPLDSNTMKEYLPIIKQILSEATIKLDREMAGFNYEKLDINNTDHIDGLKKFRNDPEFKKYFCLFQPDFDSYLESLRKNNNLVETQYLVKLKGNYIGWLNSSIYKEADKTKTLLDIFVSEKFRGKGLAKQIILDYINYAQLDEILIEVSTGNEISQKLAISLGFEPYKIDEEDGVIKYKLDCISLKEGSKKLEDRS